MAFGPVNRKTSKRSIKSHRRAEIGTACQIDALEPRRLLSVTPNLGILLLDPTSPDALTVLRNGSTNVTNGDVVIDSRSTSAGLILGNGNISAGNILVAGYVRSYGSGKFLGTLTQGGTSMADPLAGVAAPSASSTKFGTTSIRNKTVTLYPGDYLNGIQIAGDSKVTLEPGVYYLASGGLTVAGDSQLIGTAGVTIYNASTNPLSGIDFLENSSVQLTAATTGADQGVVLFQNRSSHAPIEFEGTSLTLTGEVYARSATVLSDSIHNSTITGNGSTIPGAVIAADLLIDGSGNFTVMANPHTADLAITNTDGVTSAIPGASTVYTITVTDNGPANVTGAAISDIFGSDFGSDTFTAVGSVGAGNFTPSGSGNINDTVNLASGSSITYTVTANIISSATGSLTDAASITTPAGITNTDPSAVGPTTTSTDTDTLTPQANLTITQTDNNRGSSITDTTGSATSGSQETYTIVLSNTGPSDAANVSVEDALPASLQSVTAPNLPGSVTFDPSTDTFDVGTLAAGANVTLTINGSIDLSATGTLTNSASASATDATTVSATDTDTLTPQAVLTLSMVDNDRGSSITSATGSAEPGTQFTYTMVLANTGVAAAAPISLTDTLPASLQNVTAPNIPGGVAFDAVTDTFTLIGLNPGASDTLTISGTIASSATGSLSSTASASCSNAATVSASDADTLTPQADLSIANTDSQSSAVPGDQDTYTIKVTDLGPSDATNVSLVDALPPGFTETSTTGGSFSNSAGSLTCSIGTVAAGESDTFTITGTTATGATGSQSNTASATSTDATTVTATDTDTLTPNSVLTVSVTDNRGGSSASSTNGSAAPGTTETYTISLDNTGPSDTSNVSVVDTLPAALQSVTAPNLPAGVTFDSSTDTFTVSALAAGASDILTISGTISTSATGSLTNSVSASAADATTVTATDTDSLGPAVELAITISDNFGGSSLTGATGSDIGGQIIYTIAVANAGPDNAVNVAVADFLGLNPNIASDEFIASGTPGASGFATAGTGSITNTVDLAAGSSITYTVTAALTSSSGGNVVNTASLTPPASETLAPGSITSATDKDSGEGA